VGRGEGGYRLETELGTGPEMALPILGAALPSSSSSYLLIRWVPVHGRLCFYFLPNCLACGKTMLDSLPLGQSEVVGVFFVVWNLSW